MSKRFYLYTISILLGFIYLFFIQTSIRRIDSSHFIIESKIEQQKTFHLQRENNQSTLQCNNQPILFKNPKKIGYWYKGTESINLQLHRGENLCYGSYLKRNIAQKLNFSEFLILFILLGVPLLNLLFLILISLLNKLRRGRHV